jgi:hypothetical protein
MLFVPFIYLCNIYLLEKTIPSKFFCCYARCRYYRRCRGIYLQYHGSSSLEIFQGRCKQFERKTWSRLNLILAKTGHCSIQHFCFWPLICFACLHKFPILPVHLRLNLSRHFPLSHAAFQLRSDVMHPECELRAHAYGMLHVSCSISYPRLVLRSGFIEPLFG